MGVFNYLRNVAAAVLSPVATFFNGQLGGYNATDPRRKILDPSASLLQSKASANQLLNGNLSALRAYCRKLERDNPSARAGVEAFANLVVGRGIRLEPDAGSAFLNKRAREVFSAWAMHAGPNGESLWQLQLDAAKQLPTAGESVWRIVYDEQKQAAGDIPLTILPYDAEWISDQVAGSSSLTTVQGVQIDAWGRPKAYAMSNPERSDPPEWVEAESIVHVFEHRRAVQSRGEPMLAPVIETLMQERDLVDAELYAAKQTAALGIAIESDYHDEVDTEDETDPTQDLSLGSVVRLNPGEKVSAFGHTRPSQQIAPFRQMLRGDIAAALRIPQRFLDRDVSRANYSSMRADMIDTERLLAPIREWFGRDTVGRLYAMCLPYISAIIGRPIKSSDYHLIPDGQPYVDPEKDAKAALLAIAGGLSNHELEVGKRGKDYRQVWQQLGVEKKELEAMGIVLALDTAPAKQAEPEPVPPPEDDDPDEGRSMNREERRLLDDVAQVVRTLAMNQGQRPPVTVEQRFSMDEKTAQQMGRAISENAQAPVVNIEAQPAPVVNVEAPSVRVDAARVEVPAPIVNVAAPDVTVTNKVETPKVEIENNVNMPQRKTKTTPQPDGSVITEPME